MSYDDSANIFLSSPDLKSKTPQDWPTSGSSVEMSDCDESTYDDMSHVTLTKSHHVITNGGVDSHRVWRNLKEWRRNQMTNHDMWLCEGASARGIRIHSHQTKWEGSTGLDYVSGTLREVEKNLCVLGQAKFFLSSVRAQGIERAYWAPVLMGPYRRQSPAALDANWPWPLNKPKMIRTIASYGHASLDSPEWESTCPLREAWGFC